MNTQAFAHAEKEAKAARILAGIYPDKVGSNGGY